MSSSRRLIPLAVAAALAAYAGGAQASGFALIEQNASGLGNAYAGAAAAAEDASTIYFNPAGMTKLPGRQAVGALNIIIPSVKFNNTGTTPAVSTTTGGGPFALNGTGGNAGDPAYVPNLYLSWQLDPKWFVGVGVSAPFGLKTEYDANWMGRFHALESEVKTINVNPSVAFKLNDAVSLGFGVNWQHINATLTKAVNYSFVANLADPATSLGVPPMTEGSNKIEGDDDAWGFNVGIMFNLGSSTSVGLAYRSAIKFSLSGTASYNGRPAALTSVAAASPAVANQVGDSSISASLEVPASFTAAVKHQFDPRWELLADVTWTQWSSFQNLDIVRTSGIATGLSLENTPFNWSDTWRVGLGANYRMNQEWTLRLGVAYDQTPTSDTYRTPRVPDQDRTWLAIGGQYKVSKAGAIDFGYAHIFVDDAAISMTGPPSLTAAQAAGRGSLVGNSNNKVDIFSVQYRYSF